MTTRMEQNQQAQIQQKKTISKNKVYWFTAGLLALGTLGISGAVLHQYSSSLNWADANNTSIPMAKQSIDMLYDKSAKSKKAKAAFLNLYHKIINSDGSLNNTNATPMAIAKIKSLYKSFNAASDPSNYQRKYGEILLKYSIQEQFDNLFTDDSDTSLENNVTPMQVAKLNNSTYNDLSSLYAQNPKDAFVKHIISLEKSLNNDIQILNDIASKFNNAYSIDRTTVTLTNGYHGDITDEFNSGMNNLKYNWESTKYIKHIVDIMNPILQWTRTQYSKHEIYIQDLQAKSSAFANWKQEQKDFFAKVEAIHQAALTAQKQAEQAKKDKQAAKDKADYQSGQNDGKQDADNKTVVNNFNGKSDKYQQGYIDGYKAEKLKLQNANNSNNDNNNQNNDTNSQNNQQNNSKQQNNNNK